MRELNLSDYRLRYFDEVGREVDEKYASVFASMLADIQEVYDANAEVIKALEINKPEWFMKAEADARDFMATLGFANLPAIYLLEEGDELDILGLREPKLAIAAQDLYLGTVTVREERINEVYQGCDETAVGGVLVHELTHATRLPVREISTRKHYVGTMTNNFRSGFSMAMGHRKAGNFYEEGFAHFVSGWYRRCRENPPAGLLSFDPGSVPGPETPSHYLLGRKNKNDDLSIEGPDGYAMELLAWGVEKRGIMPRDEFIAAMFDVSRPEACVPALRDFAKAVEALRPGLYTELRDFEYSKENWQKGLDLAYNAVISTV